MMSRRKRGWQGGLTLIELMIIIVVIVILAAILIPNFLKARAQGRLTGCKENLRDISTALAIYSNDYQGRYPTELDNLLLGGAANA